jgi:spermidine synthase
VESRIRSFNEDARWFAMRTGGSTAYDLIFLDAFNDLSVPYHLTTREFTRSLRQLLYPDGSLVVNVIDDWKKGRFLASYVRTLQSVFGAENVAVVLDSPEAMDSGRSTFVVVASARPPVLDEPHVVRGEELDRYVRRQRGIVLTDDYAPVDNMLAYLFTERFEDESSE